MLMKSSYRPSPLQFSSSKIFFDKQLPLLQRLGFLSPTNIDTYIKYSFQFVEEQYFLQGAEIQGFNTNHETTDQGILYKMSVANPKYNDIYSLTIDLETISSRVQGTLRSSLKAFPFLQWGIFLLFILILPKMLRPVLLYINVIGICIMLAYSVYKTLVFFFHLVKKKNTSYQGFIINYAQHSDTTFLTPEILAALQTLKAYHISKVAYTGNSLYLYQEIEEKPKGISAFFSTLFQKSHQLTEQEKADLTQRTLQYLSQPFLLALLQQQ
jgi:hypothetical protein